MPHYFDWLRASTAVRRRWPAYANARSPGRRAFQIARQIGAPPAEGQPS
ncbi:MAG: hypothetical protein U1F06_02125 [Steroidobacteraceae bacterium]